MTENTQATNKEGKQDGTSGSRQQQAADQGGHAGRGGGHGGQQSGGMGGIHGGDLHNVGSARSGMTGDSGLGGNDTIRQADIDTELQANPGNRQEAEPEGPQSAAIQQSVQREGMGHHRHSGRGNEQAIDAARDVDDLGNHQRGAAESGEQKLAR